jgi:Mn2+/Fe2+ NRAMP family transporter
MFINKNINTLLVKKTWGIMMGEANAGRDDPEIQAKVQLMGTRPIEVVSRLPTPEEVMKIPRITTRAFLTKVLGPAFIPLGAAIGSGEWLLGPQSVALYGFGVMWLVWIGSFLQTVFNTMYGRLTLATGEPPIVLFNRIWPGVRFWAWFVPLNLIIWGFWPGWALTSATAFGALVLGRIPGAAEATLVRILAMIILAVCIAIVLFGVKIEGTLEWIQKIGVGIVFIGLIIIAFLTVTPTALAEMGRGFVSVGYLPPGGDVLLLGAFWGYIAYATGINWKMINYYRDRGYGMGSVVGFIPTLIGGTKVYVSPRGKIFEINNENLVTWRRWVRILYADQWIIFFLGSLFGMMLPTLIVGSLVPVGTVLPTWGVAAHVANEVAAKIGIIGFYFVAFVGFFILFTTQIEAIDTLVRNITDGVWSTSETARRWARGDIRLIYYPILIAYVIFAMTIIWFALPLVLIQIGANMANFVAIWSVPALWALLKKLPRELRPPKWQYAATVILWILCIFFALALVLSTFGIKIF